MRTPTSRRSWNLCFDREQFDQESVGSSVEQEQLDQGGVGSSAEQEQLDQEGVLRLWKLLGDVSDGAYEVGTT